MKSLIASALAALLLIHYSAPAQAQHRHGDDKDRVYFDNHTSSMLSIYRAPISPSSRPAKNLESGDICALPSGPNVQWVVATPIWYRLVSSIKTTERGPNRLVIRDSELRAIGGTAINTTFANRSGAPVKVNIVVDGIELDWLWISNGRTSKTLSFARQDWVIRDQASGKLIQQATTSDNATTIQIDPPRAHAHTQREPRHESQKHKHKAGASTVQLTITNSTAKTVSVLRKTAFGSRRVGQIAPRRSAKIETEAGEIWRIEDPSSHDVIQTITVPDNDPHCKVSISGWDEHPVRPTPHPSRPVAASKVNIEVHNDTNRTVNLYKQKDGNWKYTKRIYPGREYKLEFTAGQAISIRDPKSGEEIQRANAPSSDTAMYIESDSKPAQKRRPSPRPASPRGILDRLINGD